MMQSQLTIIIGGDTVPTLSNEDYLINGQEDSIFNSVKNELTTADYAIVNLECPLTNYEKKIQKAGPCLKARPETIHGLVRAGIKIFSLANNHIMDFGAEGLAETLNKIGESHALSVGAGVNLEAARQVLFVETNGYKAAILSVAEHEFSIAGENAPGANPFDPFDTIEDIQRARRAADAVIVLYHGGIEHYPLPSPNLQRVCRKMVENGAGYVICQHSHCIGAYEKYRDGHIVYGQGNLLFDHHDYEMWQTGLLVKITMDGIHCDLELIPMVKKGFAIGLAEGAKKEKILLSMNERSLKISDQAYIEKEWAEFSNQRKYFYLQTFLGFSDLVRRIDNRLGNILTQLLIRSDTLMLLNNFVNCEAHLEVIKSNLKLPAH